MVRGLIPLIFLVLLSGYSADTDKSNPRDFVLDGTSNLVVVNQSNTGIPITTDQWLSVPFRQHTDSIFVTPGETSLLTMPFQGFTEYAASIDDIKYSLFSQPDATDTVYILSKEAKSEIRFGGELAEVNEYLKQRENHFGSPDAMFRPRAEATQTARNTAELFAINDSIHAAYLSFLSSYDVTLPDWYKQSERKRLFFVNEGFKLNSLFYRNSLLGKKDQFPKGYLEILATNPMINSPEMLGEIKYIQFLSDYIHSLGDPSMLYHQPTTLQGWFDRFVYFDSVALVHLNGLVKDVYMSHSFSKRLDSHAYLFQEGWLEDIEDRQLREALRGEFYIDRLPPGSESPYLYLEGLDGEFVDLTAYKGKVVLINFWATWCRPCIQEFPNENRLVKKFKDFPVEIINVCIDSDKDAWQRYVDKYDLSMVNLFASESWSDNLKKNYYIQALPQSVLIDGNGRILKNKAPRASMGVDRLIREALKKM